MRKSTLFVSTVLTMFMLATIFGVVSAYQEVVKANAVVAEVTAEPEIQQEIVAEPTSALPEMPSIVSPEQATTIAVDFIGNTDVYSVEVVKYEGGTAFLVTFSSGQLIYVSPTGEILAESEVQPVVVVSAPQQSNNNNRNSNNSGEHEDHDDDHEDHDD